MHDESTTSPPPNIVFLLSDQHARQVLGCYGNDIVRTPNIDALATRGVTFEQAYTPSPICVPARMSLLTGRYPSHQKCWTNSDSLASDIPTTAHALGAVGYRPELVGRLHSIGPDQLHGFVQRDLGDHMTDWLGGRPYTMGVLDRAQRPFPESLTNSGPGQCSYELLDREVTRQAVTRLEGIASARRDGDTTPFSLNVGYILPHQPYVADPALYAYYEDKVGSPRLPRPDDPPGAWLSFWRTQTGLDAVDPAAQVRARAAYYALVETIDAMIGEVLDALQRLDLLDNTLVVYASDHGDQLGERNLWWKQTFYEESAGVPLILSWPGQLPEGARCGAIANLVDVAATIVDAAGAPPLPACDGRSLLPIARNGDAAWLDETFSEYCTDGMQAWSGGRLLQSRMLRRGRFKYCYYHGFPDQLFDLEADPDEMHDRARDSVFREQRDGLREAVLANWDPDAIGAAIKARNEEKAVLSAWAKSVEPVDKYRWETRAEDNWLA